MPLFSRETKRLRAARNALESEVVSLQYRERRMAAELLHKVSLARAEIEATRAEMEDDAD